MGPGAASAPRALPDLIVERARRDPDALAVVDADGPIGYGDLERRSRDLAHRLLAAGVRRHDVVGVTVRRGTAFVVALLAVLRAGAAYTVLDSALPAGRLSALADAARLRHVVVGDNSDDTAWCPGARRVTVTGAPVDDPDPTLPTPTHRDPACVMFTSGSTGAPKGVLVTHSAIVDTLVGQDFAEFGPGRVWLQSSPVSWDAFAMELWGPLSHGGTCVLHPAGRVDPLVVRELVAEHGVTDVYLSAALFAVLVDEIPDLFDGLRQVIVGGESPSPRHVRTVAHRPHPPTVRNGYGPVEAMVFVTTHPITATDDGPVPIGRPLIGKDALVLDAALRPVPDGVVGELYAAGAGLALGYLGRAGETATRFVAHPRGTPGERLYRTGDLAIRRPDGVLEFAGRADDQVKIRGHRVEPDETARVLHRHPGVRQAAVIAHRHPATGEARLLAYLVLAADVDPDDVVACAARLLPDYLLPSSVTVLARLPHTDSGKLDRAALPIPPSGRREAAVDAPVGVDEVALAEMAAEVLGVDAVGRHDDLLLLGADSLRVARLIARVRSRLGVELGVREVFASPTVAQLAPLLGAGRPTATPAPVPAPGSGISAAQRRLWFLDRTGVGHAYHVPVAVRLFGPVDPDALHRGLGAAVVTHEALRTGFDDIDGEPYTVVTPAAEVVVPVLRHVPVTAAELDDHVAAAVRRRIDPAAGAPLHATLFTVVDRPGEHLLLLTLHQIAADGWSLPPLLRTLSDGYRGAPATGPGYRNAEHLAYRRGRLGDPTDPGSLAAEQLRFWRRTLRAPVPNALPWPIPADAAPGPAPAGRRTVDVDVDDRRRLGAVATEHRGTLFTVLHAALAVTLHRAGIGDDVVIGAPVAGRGGDERAHDAVGFFVNLLTLRVDAGGDPDLATLLGRVRDVDLAALDHQDVPFDDVVDACNPPRHPHRHPFTDVVLVLQNNERPELDLPGVRAEVTVLGTGAARFGLLVEVTDDGDGGLTLCAEYRRDTVTDDAAQWLLDALRAVLRTIVDDPTRTLSRIALPPPPGPATPGPTTPGPTTAIPTAQAHRPADRDLERRITDVWSQVLDVDRVAPDADFFALGGNSLLAVRATARLAADGVPATTAQLFTHPTVDALASALRAAPSGTPATPIPRQPRIARRTDTPCG